MPPAPRDLPAGAPAEVRARLARRSADELAELAGALVTLPDPSADAARAGAAMELLLVVPGEAERAARLLARIEGVDGAADASARALWRFRLGAAGLDSGARADSARWEALLAPARAVPAAAREALRLAASGWLEAVDRGDERGADWIVPVLDGRRVVNAALAALRRPALAAPDALGPALAWLDEAASLGDDGDDALGAEALIAAAERADRAGDVDEGSRLLLEAVAAATDDRLERALTARAALLVEPSLGTRAAAAQTALARRRVPEVAVTAPAPPRRDWTARLVALAGSSPTADPDLGLYEAAGSRAAAAGAWLARGDRAALLQATRLRDELTGDERARLAEALASLSSEDEVALASDPDALGAACALWWLLPAGLSRRLLFARLAERLPDAAASPEAAPEVDGDDPHSVDNRLAAGADLLDAGRIDAAVAVLVSLLKRVEGAADLRRLSALCARALEPDPPPSDLFEAVDKHLHAADAAASALLDALRVNPTGAYALHEVLLALGVDVSRADAYRVAALAAWLGIWSATGTPPSDAAIAPVARADAGLLALAAARVAGAADPVAVAQAHLARLPLGAPDEARADDLLTIATGKATAPR